MNTKETFHLCVNTKKEKERSCQVKMDDEIILDEKKKALNRENST